VMFVHWNSVEAVKKKGDKIISGNFFNAMTERAKSCESGSQ
jgi:hypothetical protein